MATLIAPRALPDYEMSEAGILVPREFDPHQSSNRQKQPVGARIDMGDHYQYRFTLRPNSGSSAQEQFADCLRQLKANAQKAGLGLGNAVQISAFAPSEGYPEHARDFSSQLSGLYASGENVPPSSVIGQTPCQGIKAALEAVFVAPKEGQTLVINPGLDKTIGTPRVISEQEIGKILGQLPPAKPPEKCRDADELAENEKYGLWLQRLACSIQGIGDARYTVVQTGSKRWVYSAGLKGNLKSSDSAERGDGALAKEMAILIKEGFAAGDSVAFGFLNSHHYIDDIVGPNYKDGLNVPRDMFYRALSVFPYPSATGIGTFCEKGDVTIEMLAASGVRYEPVIVPEHGEAYQYQTQWMEGQAKLGTSVGERLKGGIGLPASVPKFSRAMYLPDQEVMLISGTASVVTGKGFLYSPDDYAKENAEAGGKGIQFDVTEMVESIGLETLKQRQKETEDKEKWRKSGSLLLPAAQVESPSDGQAQKQEKLKRDENGRYYLRAKSAAEAQALVTIRNITRLLKAKKMTLNDMAQSRVYVRDTEDADSVMALCKRFFGDKASICVKAPVCYNNWLVEIEGIAAKGKSLIY